MSMNVIEPHSICGFANRFGQSNRQRIAIWGKGHAQNAARFVQLKFQACRWNIPNVHDAARIAASQPMSVLANGEDSLSAGFLEEYLVLQHFTLWHWAAHSDLIVVRKGFQAWRWRNRHVQCFAAFY
jgi:hypothetical protein